MNDHRIRPYEPSTDEGFVVVSWCAELVRSPTFASLDRDLAFALVRPHVRSLLLTLGHRCAIVCPATEDEPIEAFFLAEGPLLYHLHVRGEFRKQGIMTDVLSLLGFDRGSRIICATDTRDLRSMQARGTYDIVLRPDLLTMGARA